MNYDLHVDIKSNDFKARFTQFFHWLKIGFKHLKNGQSVLVVPDVQNPNIRDKVMAVYIAEQTRLTQEEALELYNFIIESDDDKNFFGLHTKNFADMPWLYTMNFAKESNNGHNLKWIKDMIANRFLMD
jgi:hypothetical protein